MLTQTELSALKKGSKVDHYLVLRKIETRKTKNGNDFLSIEIGDNSSTLVSNIWDNFDSIIKKFKTGDVVKIIGTIDEFQGTPQLKINSINPVPETENISATDFLPKSARDKDEMVSEFKNRIEKISSPKLKELVSRIFNDSNFRKFVNSPAGKSWHHAYVHGLIEHTLEIIKICDLMCDIHPEINRDLLISGAMLHDFGKTEELSVYASFNYTDKGKLVGHIVISAMLINEEAKNIQEFPDDMKNNLLHIVLSHQGKLEYASPVVPKTLEAITLYQADELSAKVNAYKSAISDDKNSDSNWTKFLHLASTDLYKQNLASTSKDDISESLFE